MCCLSSAEPGRGGSRWSQLPSRSAPRSVHSALQTAALQDICSWLSGCVQHFLAPSCMIPLVYLVRSAGAETSPVQRITRCSDGHIANPEIHKGENVLSWEWSCTLHQEGGKSLFPYVLKVLSSGDHVQCSGISARQKPLFPISSLLSLSLSSLSPSLYPSLSLPPHLSLPPVLCFFFFLQFWVIISFFLG